MAQLTAKRSIQVLVIDDDDVFRRELRRAFSVADNPDFGFVVHEAASVDEYHAAIQSQSFDVIVADLRLAVTEEGADDIIAFHHIHSPGSIIIACSAFPSLDPVQSCVRAMRAGAVDCIEKARQDGIEAVVGRAISELRDRTTSTTGPAPDWLESNLGDLVEKFGGRAIALVGDQVVADADTIPELRKALAQRDIPATPYLMRVPNWDEKRITGQFAS